MRRVARGALVGVVLSMALAMLPAVPVLAVGVPETLSHRAPVTAGPVVPGFAITHVGVLWDDPVPREAGDVNGAVRFRHDGQWGGWIPLTRDDASGRGLWASSLVAGDGADAFQVRGLPVGAGSPRTVAFNTSDGPRRTTGLRIGEVAAIESDRCLSRAEWGADEELRTRPGDPGYEPVPFSEAQVMTLHHTATGNNDPDPAGTVRAIYEYHTVDNLWQDIGYNYLISEDGTVFEGRWSGELGDTWDPEGTNPDTYAQLCDPTIEGGGGTGADFAHQSTDPDAFVVRGAHVGGYNTGNLGIALIGSFADRGRYSGVPTAAAVFAAEQLLAELAGRHDIDPEGTVDYVNATTGLGYVTVEAISGHRDWPDNVTECPGDNLYELLPLIRTNVAATLGPDDPPPTLTITSPVDGAMVSGTVQLTAVSGDEDVVQVEFFVDGTPIGVDEDPAGDWSANWDTTSSVDGSRAVTATATDAAGKTGTDSVTVTVDNEPSADPTVHIADLDGSSTIQGQKWTATVTVFVVDTAETAVSEASVTGHWSDGAASACDTGTDGTCTVDLSGIFAKRTASVAFTVTDVAGSLTYDAGANVDPDADSDGTTITVDKP